MVKFNTNKNETKELKTVELDSSKYKINSAQFKKKTPPVTRQKRANIYTR